MEGILNQLLSLAMSGRYQGLPSSVECFPAMDFILEYVRISARVRLYSRPEWVEVKRERQK